MARFLDTNILMPYFTRDDPVRAEGAYNAVYMQARGVSEVYSWDTDFEKIPGLTRLEP